MQQWIKQKIEISSNFYPPVTVKAKIAITSKGLLLHDTTDLNDQRKKFKAIEFQAKEFVNDATIKGEAGKYLLLFRQIYQCKFDKFNNYYQFQMSGLQQFEGQKQNVFKITIHKGQAGSKIVNYLAKKMISQTEITDYLIEACKQKQQEINTILQDFSDYVYSYSQIKSLFDSTKEILFQQKDQLLNQIFPVSQIRIEQKTLQINDIEGAINERKICKLLKQVYIGMKVPFSTQFARQTLKQIIKQNVPEQFKNNLPICANKAETALFYSYTQPMSNFNKIFQDLKYFIINKMGAYFTKTSEKNNDTQRLKSQKFKKSSKNITQKALYGIGWFLTSSLEKWLDMNITIDDQQQASWVIQKLSINQFGIKFYGQENIQQKLSSNEAQFWERFIEQNIDLVDQEHYFLDFNQVDNCVFYINENGYQFKIFPKNSQQHQNPKSKYLIKIQAHEDNGWIASSLKYIKKWLSPSHHNVQELKEKCYQRQSQLVSTINNFQIAVYGYMNLEKIHSQSLDVLNSKKAGLDLELIPTLIEDKFYVDESLNLNLRSFDFDEYLCYYLKSIIVNNQFYGDQKKTALETINQKLDVKGNQQFCIGEIDKAKFFVNNLGYYGFQKIWKVCGDYLIDFAFKVANKYFTQQSNITESQRSLNYIQNQYNQMRNNIQ